jgi:hypothetical protein
MACTVSVPMRKSGSTRCGIRFSHLTHHLVSHQSNGQGRDGTCIFRPYGLASEGQRQHPRPDALRHLECELEKKAHGRYIFQTYSQIWVYEGYPQRHRACVLYTFDSGCCVVVVVTHALTLMNPNFWLGADVFTKYSSSLQYRIIDTK